MNFTGKWGGGFFGNGEPDGRPGSVAGTFGAATSGGDQGLVGVFSAYTQYASLLGSIRIYFPNRPVADEVRNFDF